MSLWRQQKIVDTGSSSCYSHQILVTSKLVNMFLESIVTRSYTVSCSQPSHGSQSVLYGHQHNVLLQQILSSHSLWITSHKCSSMNVDQDWLLGSDILGVDIQEQAIL